MVYPSKVDNRIIWDEAPMAKRLAIKTVDRSLRDINKPKASRQENIISSRIIHYIRQVLPVVPKASRQENISSSLVKSYLWSKMEVLKLTTNIRARTYQYFGEFILRVGNGKELVIKEGNIRIPKEMVVKYENENNYEEALIDAIYQSLEANARLA